MRSQAVDLRPLVPTTAYATLGTAYVPAQWTPVSLDTKVTDLGNNFDPVNHRYLVPVSGIYFVSGKVSFPGVGNANVVVIASVWRNGGAGIQGARGPQSSADGNAESIVAGLIVCLAGDYLQLYNYSNNAWSLATGSQNTYLQVQKVG
jgi:hypothetical protein